MITKNIKLVLEWIMIIMLLAGLLMPHSVPTIIPVLMVIPATVWFCYLNWKNSK